MNFLWLGIMAGVITSAGFVPQLVKALATKKVDDISLLQPIILTVGIFLWFVYGLVLKDLAIIGANLFAIVCNSLLIILKIKYSSKK